MIDKTRWVRDLINLALAGVLTAAILRSWALLPIVEQLPTINADVQDLKTFKASTQTDISDIKDTVHEILNRMDEKEK